MDWDDLRYALALARERTLSRAAETLGVSHTTAGRRLRSLEEALGVRLFDRTPDGFVPTPAGQDIVEVAEAVETRMLALESRVLGQDARLRGPLRVATMDVFFARYHSVFTGFAERYPSVELTVMASDEEVSLTRREADIVLRMTNTPPEYLVGQRIGEVRFAVYGNRELLAKHGGPESASLSDLPWILLDERLNIRFLDMWVAQNAPGARIAMRVNVGTVLLRELVAQGVGLGFLACFDGDADARLCRIGKEMPVTRGLWLLTLPELRSTSRVRAFLDHFGEALRAHPAALPT